MWLFASEISAYYYSCLPEIVRLLTFTITFIQAMTLHILTEARFNNHTVLWMWWKWLIFCLEWDISGILGLPFHYLGSLMSPLYPHSPVYVAICLRGQCRLLQYLSPNVKSCCPFIRKCSINWGWYPANIKFEKHLANFDYRYQIIYWCTRE